MSEAGSDIAARVCRYLLRQIAWYESNLDFLVALPGLLANGEHEHALQRQAEQQTSLDQLLGERALLHREWQALSDRSGAEAANVKALAERSESLRLEVIRRQDAAAGILQAARMRDLQGLEEVGQGKALMDKYRPERDEAAGFLDHQA